MRVVKLECGSLSKLVGGGGEGLQKREDFLSALAAAVDIGVV